MSTNRNWHQGAPRDGHCVICSEYLGHYETKFIHPDGRVACGKHTSPADPAHTALAEFLPYSDG